MQTSIKKYRIYGSRIPTTTKPTPTIFMIDLFARNPIVARSMFNKKLRKYKIKPIDSVILKIEPLVEAGMVMKNFGIKFVRQSKKRTHNSYMEFRGVSRADAVSQLFDDMAGRQKVKHDLISVVEVMELTAEQCKREQVIQFNGENVEYPIFKKELATKDKFVPVGFNPFN